MTFDYFIIRDLEKNALNYLSETIHGYNLTKGWWDDPRRFGESIALIHSELSEALEADRKDLMDDHLPNRKGVEVELADALIRIFDLAGRMGLDLGAAVVEKFEYNKNREDHRRENRQKVGGKKY